MVDDEPGAAAAARDPLHGVTLKAMLERLLQRYGWEELGRRIPINCFTHDPGVGSSLKFLRRTPWARQQVETLYRETRWPAHDVWATRSDQRKA